MYVVLTSSLLHTGTWYYLLATYFLLLERGGGPTYGLWCGSNKKIMLCSSPLLLIIFYDSLNVDCIHQSKNRKDRGDFKA